MQERYVSIWFRYLKTDWYTRRHPELGKQPFVLYETRRNCMVVTAANYMAEKQGVLAGTILADARAIIPHLHVKEDTPALFEELLQKMAEWFIRYSPIIATDSADGIFINATGCAHLWGGEEKYLHFISLRLKELGYTAKIAMAGSIGAAWAINHFEKTTIIIKNGEEVRALSSLPPEALRIQSETTERLHKLGLSDIGSILIIPTSSLRRRFGEDFIRQLQYALGYRREKIKPVTLPPQYIERLPCLEPILTAKGIEIALQYLVDALCNKLKAEEKGLRQSSLNAYRVDGKIEQISISINKPSNNSTHVFKLFAEKIQQLAPEPGIELFTIEAGIVEPNPPAQEIIWNSETKQLDDKNLAELIDSLTNKIGKHKVQRFLPDEHYWPERSFKPTADLQEQPATQWNNTGIRPLRILMQPEPIMVTAPIPDYPPMLFRHKGKLHKIVKADGPERIEQEWWLQQGRHRDYYYVEDEDGNRYWLFRSGHYDADKKDQWFLHGYCA